MPILWAFPTRSRNILLRSIPTWLIWRLLAPQLKVVALVVNSNKWIGEIKSNNNNNFGLMIHPCAVRMCEPLLWELGSGCGVEAETLALEFLRPRLSVGEALGKRSQ